VLYSHIVLHIYQGLHPSFREIRKSLARELIILQERLDSLMVNKPQQQMQDIQKDVEVTPTNTQNEEHLHKEEEKVVVPGDSSEGNNDGENVSQSPVDPVPNEGAESVILPNGSGSEDTFQVVTADTLNSPSDQSETDKMAVEPEDKSEAKDIPIEVEKLDKTVWEELPVGVIDEDSNDAIIEKQEHDNIVYGNLPDMVNESAQDGLDSENHVMMELPVGVLDEEERDSEKNISKEETQVKNEIFIEELPVGLLEEKTEESEAEKHEEAEPKEVLDEKTEESEVEKHEEAEHKEALLAQEGECNADEETSSSTDNTSKATQLEEQQQPLEDQEKESSGESDGWVKIEFNKDDELKMDAPIGVELELQSGEGVGVDMESPPLTTNVNDGEPGNEEVCLEANDVTYSSPEPIEFMPINNTQKEEEPEGKIALKETQKDGEAETLAEEKTEPYAKLVEENEKLREMMKKLLEAGNEHLSVISDLTGRVKELEKKLARSRSKRVKTKRCRPTTFKMSSMNSLNLM